MISFKLNKYGLRYILIILLFPFVLTLILLLTVGKFDIFRIWVFVVSIWLYQIIETMILYWKSPALLNQRGNRKKPIENYDKIIIPFYFIIGVFIAIIIAGLDVGRYHWFYLNEFFLLFGVLIMILAYIFLLITSFYKSSLKTYNVEVERIIQIGPYRYIRHPKYAGTILWNLSIPLILGSLIAYIPIILAIIIMMLRILFEEKNLQKKNPGYIEYVKKVKYRMIPGIW